MYDGVMCWNNIFGGFWQFYIFIKCGVVECDIGVMIRCNIWDDGVVVIVGGDGVIVGQFDVIQFWCFNQYGSVGDILIQCNFIGMGKDVVVGVVVDMLVVIVIVIVGINVIVGIVIGCVYIVVVVFVVVVFLMQVLFQIVVFQCIIIDGYRLIGRFWVVVS